MKKLITLLITICILFIGIDNVKADYNGGGGGGTSVAGGDCGYNGCLWGNFSFKIVRIKLIYYDGSEASLTNPLKGTHKYFYLLQENGIYNSLNMFSNNSWIIPPETIYNNGKYNGNKSIEKFLLNNDSKNLKKIISKMGINLDSLTKHCDQGVGYNKKGYRVIIEPLIMTTLVSGKVTTNVLRTVKEWAGISGANINPQVADVSWFLHTDFDDIGIRAYNDKTSDVSLINNPRTGYGYNIIDACGATKQCYKLGVKAENPKCKNTNTQNKGFYQETFETTDCEEDKDKVVKNATKYGRLVKTVNKNCKIYCLEKVEVAYPGNVLPAIQTGGKFVWPTFGSKVDKGHDLNIIGTRECTAVGNDCEKKNVAKKDLYDDFKTSITLKFKQENYNDNIILEKANDTFTCDGCKNLSDEKKITLTRNVSLKLPAKTYRYINKQTGIATSTKNGASSNYTDVGYGNLPVSKNAKTTKKYKLEFTNISLGAKGIFSKKANEDTYTCTYRAKNTSSSCVCPPGTNNSGQDLWCKLANSNVSCIEAQTNYCITKDTTEPDSCPSRYCPEPYQYISLESCVIAGMSYEDCKKKLCKGNPPPDDPNNVGTEYQCPKNTPNEFMDISPCVESLLKKGKAKATAIKICQDIICPKKGIPIIYRTISLRNPFPSKAINGGISGFNTDNISGRYPGANWNSRKLVENEIRFNRGVEGNEVYRKEPLYRFELDARTIRTIRRYNANQARGAGYSDFTLRCDGTAVNPAGTTIKDGSKCFSFTFLRGTIASALKGGTCANASASTFDSCAR